MNHICILDIGKTNKKCFVFDEAYQVVLEQNTPLPETSDEDGYPCEDLHRLTRWVTESVREVCQNPAFNIRAVNTTAYGASLVHLDSQGKWLTPLYNYLKPYPEELLQQFFEENGSPGELSLSTASPMLGNLNAGLQLYRIRQQQPAIFQQIQNSLHLPQYIAGVLHGLSFNEMTSMGCHTLLWDFQQHQFHAWAKNAGIAAKFPPFSEKPAWQVGGLLVGTGLHDSSAALLPYLSTFTEPFVLISTGTWCISLNPFNSEPLTVQELAQDCLCYLSYDGKPVKAARYFGGNEHDSGVQAISAATGVPADFYKKLDFQAQPVSPATRQYRALMEQIIARQTASTRLAIGNTGVRRIFVDGGFSHNPLYMQLLAAAFPELEVFAAEVAQATAIGGALALHRFWNEQHLSEHLITFKKYHA